MGPAIRYTSCIAMSKGSVYRLVHGIVREISPVHKYMYEKLLWGIPEEIIPHNSYLNYQVVDKYSKSV